MSSASQVELGLREHAGITAIILGVIASVVGAAERVAGGEAFCFSSVCVGSVQEGEVMFFFAALSFVVALCVYLSPKHAPVPFLTFLGWVLAATWIYTMIDTAVSSRNARLAGSAGGHMVGLLFVSIISGYLLLLLVLFITFPRKRRAFSIGGAPPFLFALGLIVTFQILALAQSSSEDDWAFVARVISTASFIVFLGIGWAFILRQSWVLSQIIDSLLWVLLVESAVFVVLDFVIAVFCFFTGKGGGGIWAIVHIGVSALALLFVDRLITDNRSAQKADGGKNA